ncbi:hypothetical protein LIPSTDRAFT_223258 [Lipomyces starkeyi NRRL Y-11557]|uniref:Reverse transcriptase Ty1/copia-type domain-containing protein n=1 Tax=Lipomyces starkeyi NRRL Y-11557 TaxID=675824 RepID=A0A1E3QES3_LIPST|nr:hypothetical protein LIPSTDRAFT_223258 [Lipomyces starkeyi NRRL Y-11557]
MYVDGGIERQRRLRRNLLTSCSCRVHPNSNRHRGTTQHASPPNGCENRILNGRFDEEIYMIPWIYQRTRNGLQAKPQSLRPEASSAVLEQRFSGALGQEGFAQLQANWCIFKEVKYEHDKIFLAIYVDDIIIAADSATSLQHTKPTSTHTVRNVGYGGAILVWLVLSHLSLVQVTSLNIMETFLGCAEKAITCLGSRICFCILVL